MLSVGANVEVSQDAVPLKVDKTAPRAEGKNPTSSVEVKISHRLGISVANVTSHMCGCGNNWFIKEDNEVKTYDIVHFYPLTITMRWSRLFYIHQFNNFWLQNTVKRWHRMVMGDAADYHI